MHWCYCSPVLNHRYKVIYIGLRPVSSRKVCDTGVHDIAYLYCILILHISCVQYHPVSLIFVLSQKCKLLLDNYVIKSTVWYEYHIYIHQVIWVTLSLNDSSKFMTLSLQPLVINCELSLIGEESNITRIRKNIWYKYREVSVAYSLQHDCMSLGVKWS